MYCWAKYAPEASWPRGRIPSAGISCQPESGALNSPDLSVALSLQPSLSQEPDTAPHHSPPPQNRHTIAEATTGSGPCLPLAFPPCSGPCPSFHHHAWATLALLPRSHPGLAPLHPAYLSPDSRPARSADCPGLTAPPYPGLSSALLAQGLLVSVQQALGEWISMLTALACSPRQGIISLCSCHSQLVPFRNQAASTCLWLRLTTPPPICG